MATADVITLENLAQKLTPWDAKHTNQLYAVVDIGSNGIRFSITSLEAPFSRLLTPVFASRASISLFDALVPASSGDPSALQFPESAIDSTAAALSGFYRLALGHGVPKPHILIIATEAMRRAANAGLMIRAISEATEGVPVHVLDPPVETLLGAIMGSRSGLAKVDGGALFLDLGGGSLQMTWVDTSKVNYDIDAARAGRSMPYGAARLTKLSAQRKINLQMETRNLIKGDLQRHLEDLCSTFPPLKALMEAYECGDSSSLVDVYMCGGGFRGYGSMLMHTDPVSPYPIPSVGNYTVDGKRFKQTDTMLELNKSTLGKVFGLSKRRRHQFPSIVAVIDTFITVVPNIRRVTFCSGSNKEGALMMKLPREIRESDPLRLLASVQDSERAVFDTMLRKLSAALPQGVDYSSIPTVFSVGLGELLLRSSWSRLGFDADANTFFALHDAVTRNPNCPGLTHIGRAVLGLTLASRWGGTPNPADVQLHQSLNAILEARSPSAPFLARYIGCVTAVMVTLFPLLSVGADHLDKSLSVESSLRQESGKRDCITLKIGVDSITAKTINPDDLVDRINAAAKTGNDTKPPMKISAAIMVMS